MAEKNKIILPGETVATEEEYVPGRNTYASNGIIKAKIMGIAEFDDEKKEVKIKGKSIRKIIAGDIVTGKVMLVKESTAVIELLDAEKGKKIMGIKTAQLPVRNVSTEYVDNIKKKVKIGDLVRAKVVMASPLAIDIATNEKGLGVTKAYCSNCRSEMKYSNEKLMCLACGNVEERKWFEAEQKPREFAPRGEGFGNDRREGFRPRREGGFGGGRDFRERRPFGQSREGGHKEGHAGGEFRKQGQGFAGHQNRPQQRW